MYYKSKDKSSTEIIFGGTATIVVLLIILFSFRSCSVNKNRSERNMIPISEGYCYDQNTKIIYIESYTGRHGDKTSYSAYYDENGSLCKYDVQTGEWIPINKQE